MFPRVITSSVRPWICCARRAKLRTPVVTERRRASSRSSVLCCPGRRSEGGGVVNRTTIGSEPNEKMVSSGALAT